MPHVCGDEPCRNCLWQDHVDVCPTCVGMNRPDQLPVLTVRGMPHVCGDEPPDWKPGDKLVLYAPRVWG